MRRIILIPAYNAAGTLPLLLDRLKERVPRSDVLVINDGSTDSTARMAGERGVKVESHERNFGKGAALRTGFAAIRKLGSLDAVVTMDADLQHDPADLPAFFSERSRGANIVLGVRRRWGTGMPLTRKMSNALTSLMVSARTGTRIRDSQCGFRLLGCEVLDAVETETSGYEAETEFLIKAVRKGFIIVSVPVRTVYRNEESHMTHWHTTKRFVTTLFREY